MPVRQYAKALLILLAIVLPATACGGPGAPSGQTSEAAATQSPSSPLVIALDSEPRDLAAKTLGVSGGNAAKQPFNAGLASNNGEGFARPILAEVLPVLNTDDWRIFPDGRMQTTYRLRAGLTWHDGHLLTAEDFVFAWRVYASGSQFFHGIPQNQIEEVAGLDARTVVIRWRSSYPFADSLPTNGGLDPLPRHMLVEPFAAAEQDPARFMSLPFWTSEYVGAGPYALAGWEPGVLLRGTAFDGFALGRPKIGRIEVRFLADPNTVLSATLAGSVDVLALPYENGKVVKEQWEATKQGEVAFELGNVTGLIFQMRPEFAKPAELLDARVRQALIYTLDRQAISDALYDGQAPILHAFLDPGSPYFPEVDGNITKYPYDPRRAAELLTAAGFSRDAEGFYANATAQLQLGLQITDSQQQAGTIAVDTWRRAGINAEAGTLPAAVARLPESRASFPSIATGGTALDWMDWLPSHLIGTPANNWVGNNRGGWSNSAYDRLWTTLNSTLPHSERTALTVQLAKILSDELPAYPFYASLRAITHRKSVRGLSPAQYILWNIYEWEFV